MKKAIIFAVVLCISSVVFAYSGDGNGEPNNPYQIANVADFQQLSNTPTDWNKAFILIANIDLTGSTFTQAPIAYDTSNTSGFQGTPFNGIFDGNNHTISNLTINQLTKDCISLFGSVGNGGQISNLGIENITIIGRHYAGGLVGESSGSITSCYATGSVTGIDAVGGLVGRNNYGRLTSCYATDSVSGNSPVGGLIGTNSFGSLTSCYATGSISGTGSVGGLVGYNNQGTLTTCCAAGSSTGIGNYTGGLVGNNDGSITFCYSTGLVSGTGYVGGLVGCNHAGISTCYAIGLVTGTETYIGGLVGCNNGTATGCFWDTQTSGKTTSAGGIGITTNAMYNAELYLRSFWDFRGEIVNGNMDYWTMPAGGGYPILSWQVNNSTASNDEMDEAVGITVGSTISNSLIGATGLDITRNGYNDYADVWYYFDCGEGDKYTITVEPSNFNSTLGIFDVAQREIVFNDDFFGEKSVVILNASAGRRYYIRVAGYDGQTGNFSLSVVQGAVQAIQGDLNYDGMVNLVDYAIFSGQWLEGV